MPSQDRYRNIKLHTRPGNSRENAAGQFNTALGVFSDRGESNTSFLAITINTFSEAVFGSTVDGGTLYTPNKVVELCMPRSSIFLSHSTYHDSRSALVSDYKW